MNNKYRCDICEGNDSSCYYGYNSTYGYCDNPMCKAIANDKLSQRIVEDIEAGYNPLDWCGDDEINLII